MTNDVEDFSMCLLTVCLSSFVKHPFKSFAKFMLGLSFWFCFSFNRDKYFTLDTSSLQVYNSRTFFLPACGWLIYFLTVSSDGKVDV